ncbi:SRPBCC family protein [Nesterenkonia sp.]|uniref:SRPBCC family protein n=1 Tax=Nesterenkonia sp. TaxID=704201 RepID=UPI002635DD0A|nr:SRPBCC family protein [Nesterenkonia sp.]
MSQQKIVSAQGIIHAPAAKVFDLIADPARQPEWDGNANLSSAELGQRVRTVGEVFTMELTNDQVRQNHVVEFEQNRLIAWKPSAVGQPQPGHLWRWELEEDDDGHTVVTHTYDWSELDDPQRLKRAQATSEQMLEASIARLRELAEDR